MSYTYGDTSHKHAVTVTGSDTYTYDADGNQTQRVVGGNTYNLTYDAENRTKTVPHKDHAGDQVTRLVGVSGAVSASFVYDGDGNRVKGTVSGTTTAYLGEYFEWTGSTSTMRKFYFAGSIRVAMRTGSSTLRFLLGDHLGSTSKTTDSNGVLGSTILYYPWGGRRWSSGSIPTNYQYTDQRIESNLGLYFYNARWYDSSLARFIQADSVVPGGVQGLDRYAYVGNNPLRYTDPSGHWTEEELEQALGKNWREIYFGEGGVFYGRDKLIEMLLSNNTTDILSLKIIRSFFNNASAAHKLGINFNNIDAFGARFTFSGGVPGFMGLSADVILNLSSGELSLFMSGEGGILVGASATLVGGITLLQNMQSNSNYRGTFKAIGIMGGDYVGLNAEKFWGGVHRNQSADDVPNGSYIAAGGSVPAPNIGIYGSLSYSVEILTMDQQGYHWIPKFPSLIDIVNDIGDVLWNDIFHLP